MSEPFKIALTAVFGVCVFVVGQIFQRIFIEPIQEQRKVVGKIAHALTFHANAIAEQQLVSGISAGLTPDEVKAVMRDLRALASELRASMRMIPFYGAVAFIRAAHSRAAIKVASASLIGWSNNLHDHQHRYNYCEDIADALRIPIA